MTADVIQRKSDKRTESFRHHSDSSHTCSHLNRSSWTEDELIGEHVPEETETVEDFLWEKKKSKKKK